MKELLRAGCELLADNKDVLHKNFMWDYEMMSVAGSVIYTGEGKTVDVDRIKESLKILKKQEGVFSTFRDNMEIPIVCKMALSGDPEGYLAQLREVYGKLKKGKIFTSSFLALAAMCVCDEGKLDEIDEIVEKTKQIMKRMNAIHPVLTSDEDMAFAALLAMTDKSVDQIIEETEYCYGVMKKKFAFHGNAVQSLSHVLALCQGTVQENCDKVIAIYDALKARGLSYGKDYELASLGALTEIEMTPEELADEIADASDFLKNRKGFGDWSMGKKSRLMFAALITAQAYAPSSRAMDSAVMGGSLAIVIAEQIAIMVTMMLIISTTTNSTN